MSQSIVELYKEESLIDSCIALAAQIKKCESVIAEGQKSFWHGGNAKNFCVLQQ